MCEPKISQTHSAFSMSCRVEVSIRAKAENIWSLLTDAKDFPRWNSTVSGIEGHIREGERLRLHVPGTDRTFTPTISGVVPNERMTWTDIRLDDLALRSFQKAGFPDIEAYFPPLRERRSQGKRGSNILLGYAAGIAALGTALTMTHSFRFFGLVFVLPGVVGANLPAGFAPAAAYDDHAYGRVLFAGAFAQTPSQCDWMTR